MKPPLSPPRLVRSWIWPGLCVKFGCTDPRRLTSGQRAFEGPRAASKGRGGGLLCVLWSQQVRMQFRSIYVEVPATASRPRGIAVSILVAGRGVTRTLSMKLPCRVNPGLCPIPALVFWGGNTMPYTGTMPHRRDFPVIYRSIYLEYCARARNRRQPVVVPFLAWA